MKVAKIAMLLSLAAFLVCLTRAAWLTPGIWEAHSRANREAAIAWGDAQADATRRWGDAQADATRRELLHVVNARLESLQRAAVNEIRQTRTAAVEILNKEIGSTRAMIEQRLVTFDTTLYTQLDHANASLGHLAAAGEPAAALVKQVNDVAPLWLDCDHNADCLFNRWVGTARGVEQMSLALGKHAEGEAAAVERISENTAKLTDRFTKPATWWKAILSRALGLFRYNF